MFHLTVNFELATFTFSIISKLFFELNNNFYK